ncbi:MAG TPA: hypothetical protein VFD58_05115 [Blastocatellia bacterium]|nr:hypothetical protein [Blastocatellia bacterium]
MNGNPKPRPVPDPMPAPQLPNIPASSDDPFQPDPERRIPPPVPPDAEPVLRGQGRGAGGQNPEVEPQPGSSTSDNPEVNSSGSN